MTKKTKQDKMLSQIEQISQDFFVKFGFNGKTEAMSYEEVITINFVPTEPPLLIGRHGENLAALQHILRLIVNKILGEPVRLILDIDNYKNKKRERLEELAQKKANEVLKTGRLEILRPMTAYERRIIHLAVQDITGIFTESIGEDPYRRVMIKIKR